MQKANKKEKILSVYIILDIGHGKNMNSKFVIIGDTHGCNDLSKVSSILMWRVL